MDSWWYRLYPRETDYNFRADRGMAWRAWTQGNPRTGAPAIEPELGPEPLNLSKPPWYPRLARSTRASPSPFGASSSSSSFRAQQTLPRALSRRVLLAPAVRSLAPRGPRQQPRLSSLLLNSQWYKPLWKTWTSCPLPRRLTSALWPFFILRVIPRYLSHGFFPGISFTGFSPVLTYGSPGMLSTGYPRYFRIDRVSPGTNGFFHGTLWVLPCTCVRGTVAPQPFGLVPELGYSPSKK